MTAKEQEQYLYDAASDWADNYIEVFVDTN